MSEGRATQLIGSDVPYVVTAGCDERVVRLCRFAAATAANALVYEATMAEITSVAVSRRPFAIVMSEHLYAFDPTEFDALARDVRAHICRVPDEPLGDEELQLWLVNVLREARAQTSPAPD